MSDWGPAAQGLPPKGAGQRGDGRGCTWGLCHPHVTMPAPGNAEVTMPRGTIKGSSLPCPPPELARGQPQHIPEEALEQLVESQGRDEGRKTLREAAGGSLLQDNLLTEPTPSKHIGCLEILLNRIAVARAKECCLLEKHGRAHHPHSLQEQAQEL